MRAAISRWIPRATKTTAATDPTSTAAPAAARTGPIRTAGAGGWMLAVAGCTLAGPGGQPLPVDGGTLDIRARNPGAAAWSIIWVTASPLSGPGGSDGGAGGRGSTGTGCLCDTGGIAASTAGKVSRIAACSSSRSAKCTRIQAPSCAWFAPASPSPTSRAKRRRSASSARAVGYRCAGSFCSARIRMRSRAGG